MIKLVNFNKTSENEVTLSNDHTKKVKKGDKFLLNFNPSFPTAREVWEVTRVLRNASTDGGEITEVHCITLPDHDQLKAFPLAENYLLSYRYWDDEYKTYVYLSTEPQEPINYNDEIIADLGSKQICLQIKNIIRNGLPNMGHNYIMECEILENQTNITNQVLNLTT